MTTMKRKSISLPPELEEAIFELRKTEKFCRCSISEIMRSLLVQGLQTEESRAGDSTDASA